jgi:glycolate oxidase FAD binding subunit
VQGTLAEHGQYLPFDPLLADKATIGGTVAANLSGSRRFRYGGVRDFILGAHVVDGQGRAFRVGGKVVKNSAGFDLTKFLVGSMGAYAIMTDVTFKVFPDVPDFTTLAFTYDSLDDVLNAIYFLNQNVFELDALDMIPSQNTWTLLARMTGLAETLTERVERLTDTLKETTQLRTYEEKRGDHTTWTAHNMLSWSDHQTVVKVVLSPKRIPDFDRLLDLEHMARRYSVGGNIAWIATDQVDVLAQSLEQQGLTGLCVLGDGSRPIMGEPIDNPLSDRVKTIFDPENKLV